MFLILYLIFNKNYKYSIILSGIFIFIIMFITLVPIPTIFIYPDHGKDLKKK